MTDNTEEIERLLEEAFEHRANIGSSRIKPAEVYDLTPIAATVNLANSFSALAEAAEKMNEELKSLRKAFEDLAS